MSELILYNDDVNSATKVALALVKYLDYELQAAAQVLIITEGKGSCKIKEGDFIELYNLQNQFEDHNITTELIA